MNMEVDNSSKNSNVFMEVSPPKPPHEKRP